MAFSVRLDSATEEIISSIARRTGRTRSDVVREAVRRLAEEEKYLPVASVLDSVADLLGMAAGGDRHYAARSEEVLRSMLQPRRKGKA